jgi:hypothetical protein
MMSKKYPENIHFTKTSKHQHPNVNQPSNKYYSQTNSTSAITFVSAKTSTASAATKSVSKSCCHGSKTPKASSRKQSKSCKTNVLPY